VPDDPETDNENDCGGKHCEQSAGSEQWRVSPLELLGPAP
jgi:hypothetical protein